MTWQAYRRIALGGPPTLPYAPRGHGGMGAADARGPVGKLYGPSRSMTHVRKAHGADRLGNTSFRISWGNTSLELTVCK